METRRELDRTTDRPPTGRLPLAAMNETGLEPLPSDSSIHGYHHPNAKTTANPVRKPGSDSSRNSRSIAGTRNFYDEQVYSVHLNVLDHAIAVEICLSVRLSVDRMHPDKTN